MTKINDDYKNKIVDNVKDKNFEINLNDMLEYDVMFQDLLLNDIPGTGPMTNERYDLYTQFKRDYKRFIQLYKHKFRALNK